MVARIVRWCMLLLCGCLPAAHADPLVTWSEPLPLILQGGQTDSSVGMAFFRHPTIGTEHFSPTSVCVQIGDTCYPVEDYTTIGSRVTAACAPTMDQYFLPLQQYVTNLFALLQEGFTEAERATYTPLCAGSAMAPDKSGYWDKQCANAKVADCTVWTKQGEKWCKLQSPVFVDQLSQQFAGICTGYEGTMQFNAALPKLCKEATSCLGAGKAVTKTDCPAYFTACPVIGGGTKPCEEVTSQIGPMCAAMQLTLKECTSPDPCAKKSAAACAGLQTKCDVLQGKTPPTGMPFPQLVLADVGNVAPGAPELENSGEWKAPYPAGHPMPMGAAQGVTVVQHGEGVDGVAVVVPAAASMLTIGKTSVELPLSASVQYFRFGEDGLLRFHSLGTSWYTPGLFGAGTPCGALSGGAQPQLDEKVLEACKTTLVKFKGEDWPVVIASAPLTPAGELVVANRGDGKEAFVTVYRAKGFPKSATKFQELFDWIGWAPLLGGEPYGSAVLTDRIGSASHSAVLIATNRAGNDGNYTVHRVSVGVDGQVAVLPIVVGSAAKNGGYGPFRPATPSATDLNGDGIGDFLLTWWRPKQGDQPARFAPYITLHIGRPDGTFEQQTIQAPAVTEDGQGIASAHAQIIQVAAADVTRDDQVDLLLGDAHPYLVNGRREVTVFLCPGEHGIFHCAAAERIAMNTPAYQFAKEAPDNAGVRFLSVDRHGNLGVSIGPWVPHPEDACPDLNRLQTSTAECGAVAAPALQEKVAEGAQEAPLPVDPNLFVIEAGNKAPPGQLTVRIDLQGKKAVPAPLPGPAVTGTACRMECGRINGQRAHPHPLGHDWVTALNDRWRAATGGDSDIFCATEGGQYTMTCTFPSGKETVVLNVADGSAFVPLYKMRGMQPANYFADPLHPPGKDKVLARAVALSPSSRQLTGKGIDAALALLPAPNFAFDPLQAIVPDSTVQIGRGAYLINDILKFETHVQPTGGAAKGTEAAGGAMTTVATLEENLGPNLCDWATATCPAMIRASPVEQRQIRPDDLIAAMELYRKGLGRPVTTTDLEDFFRQHPWDTDGALLQEYVIGGELKVFVAAVDTSYAAAGGPDCGCRVTRRPPDRATMALYLLAATLYASLLYRWRSAFR